MENNRMSEPHGRVQNNT